MSTTTKGKPRERARGAGTVYWDGSRSRYVGSVTLGGRRRKVSAVRKVDAEHALNQLIAAHQLGVRPVNKKTTVAQAVDLFMERELPERKGRHGEPLTPSTLDWYRLAADLIKTEIGRIRLADLTEDDIEAMLDRLAHRKPKPVAGQRRQTRGKPLTAASLRKVRGVLQRVLSFAARRRLVTHNAAQEAKIPADAVKTQKRRSLEPDDARKLLAALRTERNGAMFALSLRIGLRPGEAAGLLWADLDRNRLHIRHGVRVIGAKPVIVEALKTAESERIIEIPDDLVDWLAQHRKTQRRERLAAVVWHDDRLMFASTNGRVLSRPNIGRQLSAVCKRAAVPVRTPNELRHSCASLLSDMGVPNELIADLLGHTTTRMVESTYRHRLRPVVDVAVANDWAAKGRR